MVCTWNKLLDDIVKWSGVDFTTTDLSRKGTLFVDENIKWVNTGINKVINNIANNFFGFMFIFVFILNANNMQQMKE